MNFTDINQIIGAILFFWTFFFFPLHDKWDLTPIGGVEDLNASWGKFYFY